MKIVLLVGMAFLIATTVNTLAMEAAALFTPAFLYVFPRVVSDLISSDIPMFLFGGQVGAYINSRLSERAIVKTLVVAYFGVGVLVFARTLLL